MEGLEDQQFTKIRATQLGEDLLVALKRNQCSEAEANRDLYFADKPPIPN